MDENQQIMVAEFCSVANTTAERAQFYLESANWQLPVALSSFFDSSNVDDVQEMEGVRDEEVNTAPFEFGEASAPQFSLPEEEPVTEKRESKSKNKSSRFASIRDLEKEEQQDEDEEEGQRFYAGGSEHSGELIVGPPRKKDGDIAKQLFREAKRHGAKPVDASTRDAEKAGDSKPKYFGGGGYKLGESAETSEFIPGTDEPSETRPMNVVLRLWSNGFSVDDGPLREFDNPANEMFLNSIKKGEIPRELLKQSRGAEVHVDMEDHRQEEYKAPKKKMKPFTGQGHMLGSPVPGQFMPSSEPAPKLSSSVDPPVVVDKSKPTTTLQIRLADGRRLKQEFNQAHRISDVRSFVVKSNPESETRPFVLMTTFPNKELRDENLTLQEAKLLNALVVQKMA